ncbi:TPA: Ig-like domain repeat protein [Escherichia coli]|uniref:Ig-like domain-containing protein n=1 Tax=Escherichia coli TaxID=562 RepID=UPI000E51AADC|nr:Ig-like domain-containing protein [Escherichia coli]RHJ15997.1 hypothetical protein DW140_16295 [Escherichia coli]HAW3030034.1 hypothetical protein [Escherichia coli]HAX4779403.1 hypothetical protein [Escherichia coli]HCO1225528.1 Ig-like domain repeat protein [Escherichia coli]HCY2418955.1 Ig-like domain repeat protein [Escherichia coli]
MQNYIAKSVDVSGFDLIITDASGNKQTIKDGLSSLLMGEVEIVSPSGQKITSQAVVDSLSGAELGLDSSFYDELIKSDKSVDTETKEALVVTNETVEDEANKELTQLKAQLENYKEALEEMLVKEMQSQEENPAPEQKEIQEERIATKLSEQLRPEDMVVQVSTPQTASKPSSVSGSSSSSSSQVTKQESVQESTEQKQTLLFITGALDESSDSGTLNDGVTNISQPVLAGKATPGMTAELMFDGKTYPLSVDLNGAWKFTLPSTFEDGSYTYELRITNPETGESYSIEQSIIIDTSVSLLMAGLAPEDDTGVSQTDGITSHTMPLLTGKTEPNSTLTVKLGNQSWTVKADSKGQWQVKVPQALEDGEYTYNVTAQDAAGNTITKEFTFTVDTQTFLTASIEGTYMGETEGHFLSPHAKPVFQGEAEAGSSLVLNINGKEYYVTADKNGKWAISLQDILPDGLYVYEIIVTDVAGNSQRLEGKLEIDTTPPEVQVALEDSCDSSVKGDWLTNVDKPAFVITTDPGSKVIVTLDGKRYELVASEDGSVTIQSEYVLADGEHVITVEVADRFGNVSTVNKTLTIDTQEPEVTGGLDKDSDSGISSSDNLTNVKNPILTGQTEAGASVVIKLNDQEWLLEADDNGNWRLQLPETLMLNDGIYTYTVTVTDKAGNKSEQEFSFTLDTQVSLSVAPENATLKDDKYITNNKLLSFAGKSEPGSVITLFIDGKSFNTTVKEDGSWSFELPEQLADAEYTYTVSVTDAAGNTTQEEGKISISTNPPVISVSLAGESDSGIKNDWITNHKKPEIILTAPENCAIKVTIAGEEVSVTKQEDGHWIVSFDKELVDNKYPFKVEVTDIYGNVAVFEETLIIDTQAPEVTGGIDSAFDTGESDSDSITNIKKPVLAGKTEPLTKVVLEFNEQRIELTSDEKGNWRYNIPEDLDDNTYSYNVTVTDAAGNITQETFEFTVDTSISLTAGLDQAYVIEGQKNATSSLRPNLSGMTDPNSKVIVNCGGKRYETVADESGKWSVSLTQNADMGENTYTVTATDKAGNTITTESKFTYVPDGIKPPYVTIEIERESDTGIVGDYITSNKRPVLTGSATPGLTVLLTVGGQTYSVEANDQGIWRLELTTDLTEGLNSIEAKVTDSSNGLTSTANSSVFIDTGVPVVDFSLEEIRDTGIKGDFITQNRWPVFVGKSEPNCTVTFQLGETTVSVKADNQGNWRVAWPNQMAANSTNNFTITIEDVAGNSTQDNVTLVVDNSAPNLTFSGVSDESNTSSVGPWYTTDLTPTLTGQSEPGVQISIRFGSWTWTTTTDNNGKWEFTLPEGVIPDNGRQQQLSFTITATDAAGNSKELRNWVVNVHKKHNFSATSELTPETDSDQKGDMVTTNARPSFQGNINLDGGGSVIGGELVINGTTYPVVIHQSGNSWSWSCALTSDLPSGQHDYTVTIRDSWGNVTTTTDTVTITNLSVHLDEKSDTGALGDNITSDDTPRLTGTCTPGAVVRVEINNKVYDAIVSDGKWYVDIPDELTDGTHSYKVIESAGGIQSSVIGEITIDTQNNRLTATLEPSGDSESIINWRQPAFQGTGEPGATISIKVNGKTWTTTVNQDGRWNLQLANANLPDGDYTAEIISTDKAGNQTSITTSFTMDRTAPVVNYGLSDDALVSNGVLYTNSTSAILHGRGEPGNTIKVVVGNKTYNTTVDKSGKWQVDITGQLQGNTTTLNVRIEETDKAGNTGTVSTQLVYDTETQEITTGLDASSATGETGCTNDKTPTLTGTAEAGATVTITLNNHDYTVTADNKGQWTFTLPELSDGTHKVSVSYTDKAGNTSDRKEFEFEVGTKPVHVADTTPVGNSDEHYFKGQTHTLTGTASPGSTVVVVVDGTSHSVTVEQNGSWNLTLNNLTDKEYTYTITATDKFGNSNSVQGQFVIDNEKPDTTCELVTDSGDKGDNITNVTNPVFAGQTKPGAKIEFEINGHKYATTADGSGKWQITVEDALGEQDYQYTIKVTDKAGNENVPQQGNVTIVLNNAQQVQDVVLADSVDIDGQKVTKDTSPQLQGKAPSNALVIVTIAGNHYYATAGMDGSWAIEIPGPLNDKTYNYSIQVQDRAGNLGPVVNGTFVIDTTARLEVTGVQHDSASSVPGHIAGTSTPTLIGKAEPGSVIVVTINDVQYKADANENGQWSINVSHSLPDGVWNYTVQVTDKVGNTSQVTGSLTVDTAAPLINEACLAEESETGFAGSQLTKYSCPKFTGITEPNATITLKVGEQTFTFKADHTGHWTFTIPEENKLTDGKYEYTVTVVDQAGNAAETEFKGEITVMATPPSADAQLSAESNTGGQNDMVTKNQQPTLCGKTTPGSVVVITVNEQQHLAKVDAEGNWTFTFNENLNEGDHAFTVKVTDPAGNISTAQNKVTIDLTSPELSDVQVEDKDVMLSDEEHASESLLTNSLRPRFEGNSEPYSVIKLTIGGHTYTTVANEHGAWSLEVANELDNKEQPYSLVTIDRAGNESVSFGSLTIDNEVAATDVEQALSVGMDEVQLIGRVEDDVVSVKVTIGEHTYNATIVDGTWSVGIDASLYKNGQEYSVEVTDQAGNVATKEDAFAVDREINTPQVEQHLWIGGDQVQITGSADEDVTRLSLVINNTDYEATVSDGKWSVNIPQSVFDSAQNYTITAIDKVGNMISETVEFRSDETNMGTEDNSNTLSPTNVQEDISEPAVQVDYEIDIQHEY